MADQFDILAQKRALQLVPMPANAARGNQKPKIFKKRKDLAALLSKVLRGTDLSAEDQEALNNSPLKGKTASDLLSEATGALSLSGQETQDIYSIFKAQGELLKAAASKVEEPASEDPSGSTSLASWNSGNTYNPSKAPLAHDTAPEEPQSAYDLLVANQNPTMGWSDPNAKSSTAPTSRQTVLDKARETLKGDTYQLGSSSYLTAAREMKKPTPFTQRTDEQVTAANVVGRERIAGRERQAKADALGRARSRMRDVATAQKGAQQFFEDTGVTPKQVRALSGERMPERRRTYEAPRDPNVVRTEAPSERLAGKTNVSYKSFSPNEVNEIEKKRRRRNR
tara:strand:- start:786 stop:1802 length:1017 start_codon:yes stop_codon:yes gene_type:complete